MLQTVQCRNVATKLLSSIAVILLTITTHAQTKVEKDLKAVMTTINDMDQMLGNDYTQIMSALDAVSGTTFAMGECMVLGAFADESHRKMCKDVEKELGANLNNSTWAFEKYNRVNECRVKVKTKAGQTENVPYNGFEGRATIAIQSLIEGLNIEAYFYQSKTDKNKYIMFFADRQMGFYFDMTKQAAGSTKADAKSKVTDASAGATPAVAEVIPAKITDPKMNTLKQKAKSKLLNKVKL